MASTLISSGERLRYAAVKMQSLIAAVLYFASASSTLLKLRPGEMFLFQLLMEAFRTSTVTGARYVSSLRMTVTSCFPFNISTTVEMVSVPSELNRVASVMLTMSFVPCVCVLLNVI